jgi:hypothetical protein
MCFGARSFLAAVAAILVFATTALADTLPAPSSWKNQRGSVLNITSVDASGSIQGDFTNNADGFDCKGISYPVSGKTGSRGLWFVVTFAKCDSFTIWRGHVKGSQMSTKWTLFYVTDKGLPAKLSGSDTYNKN